MYPLSFAKAGECGVIERISGSVEVKSHLQDLGFIKGAEIKVISVLNGNLIICIKGTRVGLHEEMARQIYIRSLTCSSTMASCPS